MEKLSRYQARRDVLQQIAPRYRQAFAAQKRTLLEAFIAATGYVPKYVRWLLDHAEGVQQTYGLSQCRKYGSQVQHALFLAWHAANQICAKRPIPFLPTLLEALERAEHLHLTEECCRQLLSMSAVTADRLLSSQRKQSQHGLSTTRAGTLLKQQIPIHMFEAWKETRPGFLEAERARPLWYRHRRMLPLHVDAHRYSDRVDGVLAPLVSQSGNGAGHSLTGTPAVPFSDPGDRY